jgi:hypothetical protein
MIYDTITNTVHSVPYYARGVCIQHEAPDLPAGFRIATEAEVLEAFPPPPVVEVVPEYDPMLIIDGASALGVDAMLEVLLLSASPRERLRWQKAQTLKGDDRDFLKLIGAFRQQCGFSTEQMVDILSMCIVGSTPDFSSLSTVVAMDTPAMATANMVEENPVVAKNVFKRAWDYMTGQANA